jgi:cation diffusion facilitator family transporter
LTRSGQQAAADSSLRRLASICSLTVAVILVVIKLAAWVLTGSVALLSSAIDALVDTAAALVTFFGVRYAKRPPDLDHRFGHGKAEAIAGFTQAAFLAGAAIVLAFESIERLFFPAPVQRSGIGLVVILGSLVAAIGLVILQSWVVRRTDSTAIAADRAHYLTDIAVNTAVLLALWLTRFTGWDRADPVFALGISGYMVWNGRCIAVEVLKQLLDRELSDQDRERIRQSVLACEGVLGIHDLRTRNAGDRVFIAFDIEVNAEFTVARGHLIADRTEIAVKTLFPAGAEVTAHLEPAGIEDERLDNLLKRTTG